MTTLNQICSYTKARENTSGVNAVKTYSSLNLSLVHLHKLFEGHSKSFLLTKLTNLKLTLRIENDTNKERKFGAERFLHINIVINNHFGMRLTQRQLPKAHYYHRHYWKP